MNNYTFDQDEVLLFRCEAYIADNSKCLYRLLVTNKYVVLMPYNSTYDGETDYQERKIPLSEIKVFEGQPQVKFYNETIELYLLNEVFAIIIQDKKQAKEFVSTINKQITGKSAYERNTEKVEKAIGVIDKAFGINTVESMKEIITNGIGNKINIFGKLGKKSNDKSKNKSEKTSDVGQTAKLIFSSIKTTERESEQERQIAEEKAKNEAFDVVCDKLIKIKNLLDAGAITQEEYEKSKAEIMAHA